MNMNSEIRWWVKTKRGLWYVEVVHYNSNVRIRDSGSWGMKL